MTLADAISPSRVAQQLIVESKIPYGSPPQYSSSWTTLWGLKVDRIEINSGSRPSIAIIYWPSGRWHERYRALHIFGTLFRIRTNDFPPDEPSIIFQGFLTNRLSSFSGGTNLGASHERNALVLYDYRWLLSVTSPVFGQMTRGPDDYNFYGTDEQIAKYDSYIWLTGRRVIFNAEGKPNKDPVPLYLSDYECEIPIFADPDIGEFWTARDMLCYCLSPFYNMAFDYIPIPDPSLLSGLDHTDFDKVLHHIIVDGLSIIEAVELICRHIGWSFRLDFNNSIPAIVFYKPGTASLHTRNSSNQIILHDLHAPAVGETITAAISQGRKMLWSMALSEDISAVINKPYGLGAPHQFEFTAELVPGWLDDDIFPDTSGSNNEHLFLTEAEIQDNDDPNTESFYKYYHVKGSDFRKDAGRKWALNESGRYSAGDYDRGLPFDFATVIDAVYLKDSAGKRFFAPFNRQLLNCLTRNISDFNTAGIRVEFSFDGGATWQILPATISSLPDEAGIYIEEPNLAEMLDQNKGKISGGTLDDVDLNYWTSLCDDKVNSRVFKDGDWRTRCRITATLQLDRRLSKFAPASAESSSPFDQVAVYDFSERYGLMKRMSSSLFTSSGLPAYQVDSTQKIIDHLLSIRESNQYLSVSGIFILDRLWLGDGAGLPDFAIGDGIEKVTGRNYNFFIRSGSSYLYPEICQIVYLPDEQKMQLLTRDLRFANYVL
jgi:hypothetical protein